MRHAWGSILALMRARMGMSMGMGREFSRCFLTRTMRLAVARQVVVKMRERFAETKGGESMSEAQDGRATVFGKVEGTPVALLLGVEAGGKSLGYVGSSGIEIGRIRLEIVAGD